MCFGWVSSRLFELKEGPDAESLWRSTIKDTQTHIKITNKSKTDIIETVTRLSVCDKSTKDRCSSISLTGITYQKMATRQAHKRLTKEYKAMTENPPPYIMARPNESNILEWHYIITGPPDTPYENGQYHGTLTFPSDYPFKPPAIRMITPSGRFQENTRLCLSMSDYHPNTWNPGWSVSTILNGLLSFMTSDEGTTGSITSTDQQKRILCRRSMEYNTYSNVRFKLVFPDVVEENFKELERKRASGEAQAEAAANQGKQDALAAAAKEKAISVEEISDPEDRIRAEQALGDTADEDKPSSRSGSSSLIYIGLAFLLFLLGISMK